MQTAFSGFIENGAQVAELLSLHIEKNADQKTHHKHEVLIKSGIVLFVACWEAFIEDTAAQAAEFLVSKAADPTVLPKELLKFVAVELKADKHELRVWDLAGAGWKDAVKRYQESMLTKHLGPFNTPRAENIDKLFNVVIGLPTLSTSWSWKGMSNKRATEVLGELVTLRGSIAHRVSNSKRVTRALVDRYAFHLIRLAISTNNAVRVHVHSVVGEYPWEEASWFK